MLELLPSLGTCVNRTTVRAQRGIGTDTAACSALSAHACNVAATNCSGIVIGAIVAAVEGVAAVMNRVRVRPAA
jgi:hypothetical protein